MQVCHMIYWVAWKADAVSTWIGRPNQHYLGANSRQLMRIRSNLIECSANLLIAVQSEQISLQSEQISLHWAFGNLLLR